MFESVESRRLFSIPPFVFPGNSFLYQPTKTLVKVSLSNGVLSILGSTGADHVTVNLANSKIHVVAHNAVKTWPVGYLKPLYGDLVRDYSAASVGAMSVDLGAGNDFFEQSLGVDDATVHGGAGDDTILGRFGVVGITAHVFGDDGNDTFEISGQFCNVDGGAGADTFRNYMNDVGPLVDYSSRSANVSIDMNSPGGDGEAGENDSVEPSCYGVVGGSGNDYIMGATSVAGTVTNGEGMFWGNDGNDTIFGGVGYDVINGGNGNDQLHLGPVGDGPNIGGAIHGGEGNDTLWGTGSNSDMLDGGSGNNVIHPTE